MAALLGAVVALAAAGCGGEGEGSESAAQPLGQMKSGSVAPLVQCRDWNEGNHEEKLATIADIRSQINLEDGPVKAQPLSDEEALSVFNNACAEPFAAGFRLYVLYARAVGFASLAR